MAVDRTDIETGRLLSAVVTWPEAQLTEHGTGGSVAPAAPKSKYSPPRAWGREPRHKPRCPWRGFPLGLAGPAAWEQGARFRHKVSWAVRREKLQECRNGCCIVKSNSAT